MMAQEKNSHENPQIPLNIQEKYVIAFFLNNIMIVIEIKLFKKKIIV